MVEHDHTVGDVLLDPVASQSVLTSLRGHDGRNALLLEPAEQPAELRPDDRVGRKGAEQHLDSVQDNSLGSDALDRVRQEQKQRLEVEFPVLDDLRRVHVEGVHDEHPTALQPVEIEAQ